MRDSVGHAFVLERVVPEHRPFRRSLLANLHAAGPARRECGARSLVARPANVNTGIDRERRGRVALLRDRNVEISGLRGGPLELWSYMGR
jgi:hypothetical protein